MTKILKCIYVQIFMQLRRNFIEYLSLISATQDLIILQYIRCKCSAIGKFLYMGNEIR